MLSEYLPAIGAALLWAISAPIINVGLSALRQSRHDRLLSVLFALLLCLVCGSLMVWGLSGWTNPVKAMSWPVFAAGLLTFPIGTGLYYLCSVAYGERAEVASQYANVKPAFSIFLGVAFFHEAFGLRELVVTSLICAGILAILVGSLRKDASLAGALLGLALALSWSSGEAFVSSVTGGASTLSITLGALCSSLAVTAAATLAVSAGRPKAALARLADVVALWPFAVHGVVSFGLAYLLFFQSIGALGLSHTVMVTTAWPTVAVALQYMISRARGRPYAIRPGLLIAMVLFAAGSITFVLTR